MSTYAKAWTVNGIWTLFMLTALVGFARQAIGIMEIPWLGIVGAAGYLTCVFLANAFPKCPNCAEPVNEPLTTGNAGSYTIRPDRPPRECGYCGQDLTASEKQD